MKIVINRSYGGFGLSRAAVLRAREITGNPTWGGPCIDGDTYDNGDPVTFGCGLVKDVPRHDPVLVHVVEELGLFAASGPVSTLSVETIPAGTRYRINEYDGMEGVETADSVEWSVAT